VIGQLESVQVEVERGFAGWFEAKINDRPSGDARFSSVTDPCPVPTSGADSLSFKL
jgi:hypothetical protein